jgi:FkbM family methyltransferase
MNALKRKTQAMLARFGLHNRLRASFLYNFYWKIAGSRRIDEIAEEFKFYRKLLDGFRAGDLIFDIGANDGTKCGIFLKLGARVVAVDPDEQNQKVIKEKYLTYRITPKPVVIVGKAVSDKTAVEVMWIDAPGSALNTLSRKWADTLETDKERFGQNLSFARQKEIETTTLEQLMITYGQPFYVKIDVEGYERNVLSGLQRAVRYLSFEVNLPEFMPEGLECVEMLGRLASDGKFNYTIELCDGLRLDQWVGATEFKEIFKQFPKQTVEVFWNVPTARGK